MVPPNENSKVARTSRENIGYLKNFKNLRLFATHTARGTGPAMVEI